MSDVRFSDKKCPWDGNHLRMFNTADGVYIWCRGCRNENAADGVAGATEEEAYEAMLKAFQENPND